MLFTCTWQLLGPVTMTFHVTVKLSRRLRSPAHRKVLGISQATMVFPFDTNSGAWSHFQDLQLTASTLVPIITAYLKLPSAAKATLLQINNTTFCFLGFQQKRGPPKTCSLPKALSLVHCLIDESSLLHFTGKFQNYLSETLFVRPIGNLTFQNYHDEKWVW